MNTYKHSNKQDDWMHIAPRLAAMPKVKFDDLFVVPENYFNELEISICNHPLVKPANNFNLPENYFAQLSEKVSQHPMVSKQSPFLVPENYFEQLPLRISQKGGFAPIQNGMEVPEGYFENLPYKIQDRIYQKRKEAKVFWLPQAPQYRVALVAAVITVIAVMVFYLKMFENPSANNAPMAMNTISTNTINAATDEILDYDEGLLIEQIDKPEQITISVISEQELAHETITEYLIENDITAEDIAEEI